LVPADAVDILEALPTRNPNEQQSEGIDYRADGRGFITSGEGASAPIMRTDCAP